MKKPTVSGRGIPVANSGRRRFLVRSLRFGAYVAATVTIPGAMLTNRAKAGGPPQYDCIVIGAGMAGVTAARNLMDPGPQKNSWERIYSHTPTAKKVLVLEGSNRIGGRVLTDRTPFNGNHVEMGGENIHVSRRIAPIWDEVKRYDLDIETRDKHNDGLAYHHGVFPGLLKSNTQITMDWGIGKAMGLFGSVDHYSGPDISAAELVKLKYPGDEFGQDILTAVTTGYFHGTTEDISIKGYQSDNISDLEMESNEYYVAAGYGTLIEKIAQNVDIKFGQKVDTITTSPSGGVVVTTRDGLKFFARTLVCTVSLAMLKSGEITFNPPLSDEKLAALNSLKQGSASKVVMRFKERFWPEEMTMFNRLDKLRNAGLTYLVPYQGEDDKPRILTALLMGSPAQKLDKITDVEDLLQLICGDLDPAFPDAGGVYKQIARKPGGEPDVVIKRWKEDEFAKGGTSYITTKPGPGATLPAKEVRAALAYPSPPIFWAGEATSTDTQAGSVHGAHASGQRAAQQVSKWMDKEEIYTISSSHSDWREKYDYEMLRQRMEDNRN